MRLACHLVKVLFHVVSQQKTRSSGVVFDVALAVRPIRNNTFRINWYIALFPNPVGSTAKASLPWHTILRMHSLCLSLSFVNGSHTATQETTKYLLFLDQSEKSPDSGLATDKYSSNCIRRSFPPRNKGKLDRRLGEEMRRADWLGRWKFPLGEG